MKQRIAVLAALLLVFGLAGTAAAGLIGSKHDMAGVTGVTWAGDQGKAGACSYCHIPHKATGAKAWSGTTGGTAATIGTIGTLCYNCHGSAGVFSGSANVSATLAFDMTSTGAHGLTTASLPTTDSMAGAPTLPYTTSTNLEAGMIQCSSCHDAHNDVADPFLQANGTDINGLCLKCHQNRTSDTLGYLNTAGTHPSNVAAVTFKNEATAPNHPTALPTTFLRAYRDTGQTPTTGTEQPWLAGAHTSNGTNTGYVVCGTCHTVHGLQSTGQTTPTIAQANETGTARKVLIPAANAATASTFCEACHTANPGGTDGTHPVNVAGVVVGDVYNNPGTPFINPTNKAICRQCHGVHTSNAVAPSVANTPLLVTTLVGTTNFCTNCHAQNNTFLAKHHPADTNWGDVSMATNAQNASPTLNAAAWNTTQLTCYNCHNAHNATDTSGSLLRHNKTAGIRGASGGTPVADNNSQGMCVACHTNLPGVYSLNDAGDSNKSSHFIGLIGNGSGGTPDLRAYAYFDLFPGTSAPAKYQGSQSAPVMICQSCHTLMGNGATTGSSPAVDVHLLVASYGNTFVAADTDEGLCRVCHVPAQDTAAGATGNWFTGFQTGRATVVGRTHPLNKLQDGTTVNPTKYPVKSQTGNKVTYTANSSSGQVNCESCHTAHSAKEAMGGYILEETGATANYTGNWNPSTPWTPADRAAWFPTAKDESGFCLGCHTQ